MEMGNGKGKALASDLDGTLLLHHQTGVDDDWTGYFLPKDVAAIDRFRAEGGIFGMCSGRALAALTPELERGGVRTDFLIVMSGAAITDGTGKVLFERTIGLDLARRIYGELKPLVYSHLLIQADDAYYDLGRMVFEGVRNIQRLDDLEGRAIHGLAGDFATDERAAEVCARVNEEFGEEVFAVQNMNNVDISPVGCSKGTALERTRELFGIDLFAGIGDSYNDLTMLEAADVAYTFNHSPEEVRSVADVLVDTEAEAIDDLLVR